MKNHDINIKPEDIYFIEEEIIQVRTKGMKVISSILLCAILTCSIAISAKAALNVWYSSSSTIGTWQGTQVKYGEKKLNSKTNFTFYEGGLYAKDQWNNALNISINSVLLMSSANIKCYGGTAAELQALGFSDLSSTALGYVNSINSTTLRSETINGSKVTVSQFSGAEMVIYDKGYMSNYNTVTTHELGHALGWMGHSSVNTDIMYTTHNSATSTILTTRDKAHLKQVY